MAEVLDYSGSRGGGSGGGVTVAKPSGDYRWRRYALVAIIFGAGLWFMYDGFVAWPNDYKEQQIKFPGSKPQHSDLDILLNKCFGVAMPPLSLLFLGWVFYNSRGIYKLEGDTLHVPGHPPVSVGSILRIDKSKWDRKGIAYLHYQIPGAVKLGIIRLDDFIYDRKPTDAIFEKVEKLVEAGKASLK